MTQPFLPYVWQLHLMVSQNVSKNSVKSVFRGGGGGVVSTLLGKKEKIRNLFLQTRLVLESLKFFWLCFLFFSVLHIQNFLIFLLVYQNLSSPVWLDKSWQYYLAYCIYGTTWRNCSILNYLPNPLLSVLTWCLLSLHNRSHHWLFGWELPESTLQLKCEINNHEINCQVSKHYFT